VTTNTGPTGSKKSFQAPPTKRPLPSIYAQCHQRVDPSGRIHVSKKAWAFRGFIIALMIGVLVSIIMSGILLATPILFLALVIPIQSSLSLTVGWFYFRNPASGAALCTEQRVSVVVPVYNQEKMIDAVIESIFNSTYPDIELIAVNDGSKDGTIDVLKRISEKYPHLKVINKENEGKRKAVAAGFHASTGDVIVLIDSDSILDKNAISELVKALNSNPAIGGAVGHVKVWNAHKNFLTRCQDSWYDSSFNISKACESVFGSVTCLSGCLAAYRREAIQEFIPYWMHAIVANSDDRELTSFVLGDKMGKKVLKEMRSPEMKSALDSSSSSLSQYLKRAAAGYDDAEDRILTAQTLESRKTVYVPSAVVYTDVPEKLSGFLKQQKRWKKGSIRTNFFVSTFFWQKRHPLMTLIYYLEFMSTFSSPILAFAVLIHEPLIRNEFGYTLLILASTILLEGMALGLDYKMRDPLAKNWMYKPMMNLITNFVLSWLLFPALWDMKKNNWGTR
jgi:hyaluronan synthase